MVIGQLPDCEADELLRIAPAIQPIKPRLINEATLKKDPQSQMSDHDGNLESALEQSRSLHDNDDQVLQSALKLSMEGKKEQYEDVLKTIESAVITFYKIIYCQQRAAPVFEWILMQTLNSPA